MKNTVSTFCMLLCSAVLLMAGCTNTAPDDNVTANSEIVTETVETEMIVTSETEVTEMKEKRTLCGVKYWFSSGTMYGADIHIHITDKELVYASYYPWEGIDNYDGDEYEEIIVENVPIDAERWCDIEKAVNDILPLLGEGMTSEEWNKPKVDLDPDIEILDGGDRRNFILTWRDENGEETELYYKTPGDRRFLNLLDLLKETAHPVGREITW